MKRTLSLIIFITFLFNSIYSHAEKNQTLPKLAKPFPAVDFSLQGEDGNTYRLSNYRGQVVVMNFWATWCPPCRYEMPAMENLWQKVKGRGVVVLGINVGENADIIFEFTGQYPVSFPLPMDIDGKVIESYPVRGLPTTYVVDPSGMVTHRAVGSRDWDGDEILKQLMQLRKVR